MHFPFRRRRPSRGLNLRQFALVPVTAVILALTGLPSGATTDVVPPNENKDLPDKACGLDLVLILDRSGSIGRA